MNFITSQIPNTITCLNILSGCVAIICASFGESPLHGLTGIEWAYIFIGIAAVADFCDGLAARTLHAYSELGKQLDSLCDAVSFGVAPAMTLYFLTASQGAHWGLVALLIPIAGVIRLARFNIDTRQTTSVIGLPIPANAIFWIGYTASATAGAGFLLEWWVLVPVVAAECWLMVSPLPIFSLKMKSLGWRGNEARWILAVAAVALVATLHTGGLLWLIIFYVLLSMLPFARRQAH